MQRIKQQKLSFPACPVLSSSGGIQTVKFYRRDGIQPACNQYNQLFWQVQIFYALFLSKILRSFKKQFQANLSNSLHNTIWFVQGLSLCCLGHNHNVTQ